MEDRVFCPLVDTDIEDIDCIETRDVVVGIIKDDFIPSKYKKKENWKEICKKCKYHNY